MLGLCGFVVASISVGVDVAVQVEHLGRQPLLHDRDRRLRLGLRLGQEVAVEVEAVAVGALPAMRPSGFWITLKTQDRVVEDRVDLGVRAVRRRREPLDELHRRVDALVLVAVDAALDEDRHLDRVAASRHEPPAPAPGPSARACGSAASSGSPCAARFVSSALIVTRYIVAAERRLADRPRPSSARRSARRSRRACSRSRSTGCAGSCRPDVPGRCRRAGCGRVRLRRAAPRRRDRRRARAGAERAASASAARTRPILRMTATGPPSRLECSAAATLDHGTTRRARESLAFRSLRSGCRCAILKPGQR